MMFRPDKRYLTIISLIIFSLIFCQNQPLFAQNRNAEEIAVQFEVSRLVRQDILVLYDGRTVYLPLIELFRLLDISITTNINQQRFSGTLPVRNQRFEIDLNRGEANIAGRVLMLDRTEYFMGAIDLYLRVDQFERLFELPMKFSFSKLSVHMPLDKKLPGYQKLLRQKARKKLTKKKAAPSNVVIIPQKRDNFNGGVADWVLSTNPISTGGKGVQYLSTNLGAVIMGGDFSLSGSVNSATGIDPGQLSYRWHYYLENNKYITQVELGKIFTGGSLSRGLTGFKITNKPQVRRRFFRTAEIAGRVGTDYEVELYVNGKLTDFQTTDQNGEYRFDINQEYGSTRIQLKLYGPNGEIRTEDKFISTPFNLIPKSTTEYTLSGGVTSNTLEERRSYGQASIYYGAADNFTVGVSSDLPLSVPDEEPSTFDLEATYLLKRKIILGGLFSPSYRAQLSFSYTRVATISVSGNYTKYSIDSWRNRARRVSSLGLTASSPFKIGNRNLGLRLSLTIDNFLYYRQINTNLGFNVSMYRFYLNYIGNNRISDYGTRRNKAMSSRVLLTTNYLRWFRPQARIDYDHTNKRLTSYAVYLTKQVFSRGQVTLSYENNPTQNNSTISIKFFMFTDFANFTSRFTSSGKYITLNQTQRGSIRFDHSSGSIRFDRRNGVGFGSAFLRPFIDYNYNGVYDGADQFYPGVKAHIKGGRTKPSNNSGDTYYYYDGLLAYDEYLVTVDKYSIDNPTLIPMAENYKVTFVPNIVTAINVPLVKAAEINGRVQRKIGQNLVGVGGIRVHLVNISRDMETQITTFNAGDYFYLGLLPGQYRAFIDPVQLATYSFTTQPVSIEFEVGPIEGGAIIEDIDFLLIPKTGTD